MSLQSLIGDVKTSVGQNINSFLDNAWSAVNGTADKIGTYVANIWDGGFAGVSNFEELKSAISEYSKNVQTIVDEYDASADLDQTFKGVAAGALPEFIAATKSLLDAYAKLVEKWNVELDEAFEKYTSGDQTLSQNVSQDAQQVQSAAQNVDIG